MYVIPDSDIWESFFAEENIEFEELLERGEILVSPIIFAELKGSKSIDNKTLQVLKQLPQVPNFEQSALSAVVSKNKLKQFGLAAPQTEMLATAIALKAKVWTHNRSFRTIATVFGLCFIERD